MVGWLPVRCGKEETGSDMGYVGRVTAPGGVIKVTSRKSEALATMTEVVSRHPRILFHLKFGFWGTQGRYRPSQPVRNK